MELRVSLSGEDPFAPPLRNMACVGLLRGEYLLRSRGEYLTVPGAVANLQSYVHDVCRAFAGKPVWYRLCDLWSDEANTLKGADITEEEHNPIIGVRGVQRGLEHPPAFDAELDAIIKVAQEQPNLHLLAPFVHDADEFAAFVGHLDRRCWPNRVGTMVEIPAAVLDAARLVEAGASNLLIGLNDLTCLMLGRERGPSTLKMHRAVWWAIEHVRTTIPTGVEWGIGGSLSIEVLTAAERVGAPYVTIHYEEMPVLLGSDPEELRDVGHVQRVKAETRAAKRERLRRLYGAEEGS